jgi:hypothetical protein
LNLGIDEPNQSTNFAKKTKSSNGKNQGNTLLPFFRQRKHKENGSSVPSRLLSIPQILVRYLGKTLPIDSFHAEDHSASSDRNRD